MIESRRIKPFRGCIMEIHRKLSAALIILFTLITTAVIIFPGIGFPDKNQETPDGSSGTNRSAFMDDYLQQPGAALAASAGDGHGTDDNNDAGEQNELSDEGQQHGNGQSSSGGHKGDKTDPPAAGQQGNGQGTGGGGRQQTSGKSYVLGFYVDKEYPHPSSYDRMVANAGQISAIAPFWYRLSPSGQSKLEEHHSYDGFTKDDLKAVISKAHQKDMEVLLLVHNMLYGGKANGKALASQMLATAESRGKFIDNVEKLLKEFDYDGINMDIENISLDDRDRFSKLIEELYNRISPQGYKVTVCVPAKTGDNRSNSWSGPFDYEKIGKYSDYVAIMTYDEHGYSSGPGPVASYGWVRDVIKYAVGVIPAKKILMGIPGYGFDWTVGRRGPAYLSYSQAIKLSSDTGAEILWDNDARVPYFKYKDKNGRQHEVWFESKFSLEQKLKILDDYKVGGIALWRIGLEDAGMWDVIKNRMDAMK
jgi:spore germination protein